MQAETWNVEFSKGLLNPKVDLPQHVSGKKRYDVYRNNVTVSLVAALGNNFPAIKKLLGATYFDGFARDFAQQNPPTSRLMFEYGAGFPKALSASSDLIAFPYFEDVATLEIFWRESYHETDCAAFAAADIAKIPAEQLSDLKLASHPALRLLHSHFATAAIFNANREQSGSVDNWARPEFIMLTRPTYDVILTTLTEAQYIFITALQNGGSLGTAAEHAFTTDENFDVSQVLAIILQTGAFATMQEH